MRLGRPHLAQLHGRKGRMCVSSVFAMRVFFLKCDMFLITYFFIVRHVMLCFQSAAGFQYATCFNCKKQGHLASQCPLGARSIYPRGGCCHRCGAVNHLAKNCDGSGAGALALCNLQFTSHRIERFPRSKSRTHPTVHVLASLLLLFAQCRTVPPRPRHKQPQRPRPNRSARSAPTRTTLTTLWQATTK